MENIINWWQQLGAGEQILWAVAVLSNFLFVVQIALNFLIGHDGDISVDSDSDSTILSIRSLLAFGMFLGWTGIVMRGLGFGWPPALLAGVAAGMLAVWLAWRLLRGLLTLQTSGTLDMHNAIGKTGHVHLTLPAADQAGQGRIMVEVQGALRELEAVAAGEAPIATGTPILVVGLTDDGVPIAQPFSV